MGNILHFVGPRKFIQSWLDNSIKCNNVSFCYFLLCSCSSTHNLFHEESKTSYISPTRSGHALGIWICRCTYLLFQRRRVWKLGRGAIMSYPISSYSFRGNYTFLNLEIPRSHYIRPKVTVHKGAETIQGRKLFKGGNYMRKYGI